MPQHICAGCHAGPYLYYITLPAAALDRRRLSRSPDLPPSLLCCAVQAAMAAAEGTTATKAQSQAAATESAQQAEA